ncbi:MAG: hypothetical protein ABI614_20015 [Planctomycetota bacterium]
MYILSETTIAEASKIEQWSYFLLYADRSTPERLRELLPGVEFQQAITVIEVPWLAGSSSSNNCSKKMRVRWKPCAICRWKNYQPLSRTCNSGFVRAAIEPRIRMIDHASRQVRQATVESSFVPN